MSETTMKSEAEKLGGQSVFTEPELLMSPVSTHLTDPCIVFFELRRKFDDEAYGVLHITVRDQSDDNLVRRLDWFSQQFTGKPIGTDWEFANEPKPKYGGKGGGGGGQNRPHRIDAPADGWFKVTSVCRFVIAEGKRNAGKSFVKVRGAADGTNYYEAGGGWEEIIDNAPGFPEDWRDRLPQEQWKDVPASPNDLWVEVEKRTSDQGSVYWNIKGFQLRKKSQ